MRLNDEDKIEVIAGAGGCLIVLIVLAAMLFLEPLIIVHAWSLFAVGMFGLPVLEYWTAFWVNLAIGCLFGGTRFTGGGHKE